jgi:hypothetical protein
MRRLHLSHPDEEQLLRYLDGELPAGAAGEIRSHLEACWQCRVDLEELQNTVGECVRYRKNVLQRYLPPPPASWTDIHRRFAEIDASLDQAGFRDRLTRALRWPINIATRWAPVAAALVAAIVLVYRFRQTPSVEAAELLRKAIAAADSQPRKPRKIQIRTINRRVTRVAVAARTLAANDAETEALAAMFRAARYDWDDPLSAKSYQAWRDQLTDRREEVIEERDGYRIRTNTRSGELTEASLKIRTPDLHPVEERLRFRNQDCIEISELEEDASPAPETIVAGGGNRIERSHETPAALSPGESTSAESANANRATIGDELRVLAALHQVGADLGDPIEVSRARGQILVAGVGIAPQRQQEIRDALSSQKRAVVRFSESAPAKLQSDVEPPAGGAVSAEVQQLQNRMAEQIGGRSSFTQLASQVLDLSEPMMSRAYALRLLAERIPVAEESELSAQDRRTLRSIQREHTVSLRREAAQIDRVLRPALEPVSSPLPAAPGAPLNSVAWQPATEELFQSARRVDKLLAMMFGAAPAESAGEQLPSQLLSSLAQLRATVDAYDRLSAQALERSDK